MTTLKEVLSNLPSKTAQDNAEGDTSLELMANPDYLRQSSTLISEALKKGFDVLQLDNGEIVTTGTKTIVYKYRWDEKSGKMKKVPNGKKSKQEEEEFELADESA